MAGLAPRFAWALDILPVRPADRLLEIGCGHGIALEQAVQHLKSGSILGIDRSQKMIDAAAARNAEAIASGRIELRTGSLVDVDPGQRRFDTIYAINVALFARDSAAELARLHRALKPSGAIYLFYESPSTQHVLAFAKDGRRNLETAGFAVEDGPGGGIGACLIARRR